MYLIALTGFVHFVILLLIISYTNTFISFIVIIVFLPKWRIKLNNIYMERGTRGRTRVCMLLVELPPFVGENTGHIRTDNQSIRWRSSKRVWGMLPRNF